MTTDTTVDTAGRGSRIRTRREAIGVTRATLASVAGCSPSFLQNVEQGYDPRKSRTLDRIEAALERLEDQHRATQEQTG